MQCMCSYPQLLDAVEFKIALLCTKREAKQHSQSPQTGMMGKDATASTNARSCQPLTTPGPLHKVNEIALSSVNFTTIYYS